MRKRRTPARTRACPSKCGADNFDQREVNLSEYSALPRPVRTSLKRSSFPWFICTQCLLVYVREFYLDIKLGRLVLTNEGLKWQSLESGKVGPNSVVADYPIKHRQRREG